MLLTLSLLLTGCTPDEAPDLTVVDRAPGDRAPRTSLCDPMDALRCALPWPSNTFTRVDPTTETGLRLALTEGALPIPDRVDFLNTSDGFSRVTGVVTGIEGPVGEVSWDGLASLEPDAPLQLLVAQHDHPDYGRRIPLHTELRDVGSLSQDRHLLIGRPIAPMPANADHVVVVLDTVMPTPDRLTRVALALEPPTTEHEAALAGYHAPTRKLLDDVGLDPQRVSRVWDFTTRSAADPTRRMHAMMRVLDSAVDDLGIEIDSAVLDPFPELAAIVRGRLTNAPGFLDDAGYLVLDSDGNPTVTGPTTIEFRISVPSGDADYHVALYGHGTGGDVNDSLFDRELGAQNIAKLNLRFDGWTGEDFVYTLVDFASFLDGSARSTQGLMQALAGGTVLLTALDGVLGDTLAGPTLANTPNPAAGRRPLTDHVVWVGGSMGGTMGAVMVSADERLKTAVLNVPGAGWTHMIPSSMLFTAGMQSIMLEVYPSELDLHHAVVMAQNNWDDVDGAVWADEALAVGGAFLLQQSMGDPILPNLGTELLANALGAVQLEPLLEPIVGLESTSGVVTAGAALEQFRVPNTGQYDVHGFASRGTPASDAALEQIMGLLHSAWAGNPEMRHPEGCALVTPDGSCDFSDAW